MNGTMQLELKTTNQTVITPESIPYMLKVVNQADNMTKNEMENQIVGMEKDAIPYLIKALEVKGTSRGVAAMALIRIGKPCIAPLLKAAQANKNLEWVVNFILGEVEGSRQSIYSQPVHFEECLVC